MALIKCPECSREISDQAASCLHGSTPSAQSAPPWLPHSASRSHPGSLGGPAPASRRHRTAVAMVAAALDGVHEYASVQGGTQRVTDAARLPLLMCRNPV